MGATNTRIGAGKIGACGSGEGWWHTRQI